MARKATTSKKTHARTSRQSSKPPQSGGYLLSELAAETQLSISAIRYYLARNLIPRAEFRGVATRYSREALLRLKAIGVLQQEKLDIVAIRARLNAMSLAELEHFVATAERAAALAASVFQSSPPPSPGPPFGVTAKGQRKTTIAPPAKLPAALSTTYWASESWERIAVLPGLEIAIRSDASPLARRLAAQFYADCAGVGPAK